MTAPLLSIVIPTRDRPTMLREALDSVQRLAAGGIDLEVIVVNASAEDGGVGEIASAFNTRVVQARGAGAAAARNAGMSVAAGEFLLFLDDDDMVLPTHAHTHLQLLCSRHDLGAVFGQIQLCDVELNEISEPYPLRDEVDGVLEYLLSRPHQIGSVVVRTSVRQTVGGFDESLRSSEDWDWMLRLAIRHPVEFVDVPSVLFRQRPAGSRDELNLMRLGYLRSVFVRNARRARAHRPPLPALLRMFVNHNGLTAGHFLISSRGHAASGDAAAARFAFRGAVASSPAHVVWALLRDSELLWLLFRSHLPRRWRGADVSRVP